MVQKENSHDNSHAFLSSSNSSTGNLHGTETPFLACRSGGGREKLGFYFFI
jgi:hypothetical protein